MVAVLQRKEEFKVRHAMYGFSVLEFQYKVSQTITYILSQFGFIYYKGCPINFLRFFTDRSTVSKKIEMNKNYGTLHWSKDQDLPHFR